MMRRLVSRPKPAPRCGSSLRGSEFKVLGFFVGGVSAGIQKLLIHALSAKVVVHVGTISLVRSLGKAIGVYIHAGHNVGSGNQGDPTSNCDLLEHTRCHTTKPAGSIDSNPLNPVFGKLGDHFVDCGLDTDTSCFAYSNLSLFGPASRNKSSNGFGNCYAYCHGGIEQDFTASFGDTIEPLIFANNADGVIVEGALC
jgi:hypothetical protein